MKKRRNKTNITIEKRNIRSTHNTLNNIFTSSFLTLSTRTWSPSSVLAINVISSVIQANIGDQHIKKGNWINESELQTFVNTYLNDSSADRVLYWKYFHKFICVCVICAQVSLSLNTYVKLCDFSASLLFQIILLSFWVYEMSNIATTLDMRQLVCFKKYAFIFSFFSKFLKVLAFLQFHRKMYAIFMAIHNFSFVLLNSFWGMSPEFFVNFMVLLALSIRRSAERNSWKLQRTQLRKILRI